MIPLPPALHELLNDPEGKRAEACIVSVVLDLERAGIKPKAVAKALSRVLLAFCLEKGKDTAHFGWAFDCLAKTGKVFETKAEDVRRLWVQRFLQKTGRLYREACLEIEIITPPPEQLAEQHLRAINPQGSA